MASLSEFVRQEKDGIVSAFTRLRPRAALAPRVPGLLAALADALEHGSAPKLETSTNERSDLQQLIGEVGVFRDAIYECLEARGVNPTIPELRILGDVMTLVLRDAVTELSRGRDDLIERQRRELLELFQQSPGFLAYVRGRELVYELENEAYRQIIGGRDVHGKPIREALPELEGQGFFEMLEGVIDTGKPVIGRGMQAHLQRTPNAPLETVMVDLIFQPIRDAAGTVVGVLMQGNDQTAVFREEASRRKAEARYQTLFQSLDDGYCLMQMIDDASGRTVDYRFLETNAAFEGQTGLVGALGKTARELVPDLDASWFDRYGTVAKTGVSTRFESHAPAMGRWFDAYASRVGDPKDQLVALVFKDVTARKEVEAERESLLARESAARKEAESANRLRDDFLATVSHELRTPLNAMLGWVQMLRVGTLTEEKQKHALATIERNARAQTSLIDDLLDITRILAGKLRLELEPIEVKTLVDRACDAIQPAALARHVRVECHTPDGVKTLGDAHRLQQVLANLLSNAVKFTPREGEVRVDVEVDGDHAHICVKDTGQGIAPEFLPHVFERFRQASTSTSRTHGGLGLGLTIVRQLVELHGGSVSAHSDGPGRGSTFTVSLPLASSSRQPSPVDRKTPTGFDLASSKVLAGLDVLLVEDEPDTREMLRTMTEMLGGRVRVTASAAEAFASLTLSPPDLLLSDIGMPEEDGYSLMARVRELSRERGGEVPAVALTAFSRTEERTRALQAGFDAHVPKPVEAAELTAVLDTLVRRVRKSPGPP